jgi:hypothetical protein
MTASKRILDLRFGLRHADDHGASAREFFVGDFCYELQVEAETLALFPCHVVEK